MTARKCQTHGCTRYIEGGSHCCRPCMRSDGQRHALSCAHNVRKRKG